MIVLRYTSFLWSMLHSLVIFLIFFKPRCPARRALVISCSVIGVLLAVTFLMMLLFGFDIVADIGVFTCTLPSLVLFFLLSQYRDGRFFFLFCFCDTCSLWIMMITNLMDRMTGDTCVVLLVSRLIAYPAAEFFAWRYLRGPYQELQDKLDRGWWTFAVVAAIYYVLIFLVGVPSEQPLPDAAGMLELVLIMALMPLTYLTILRSLWQQIQIFENRWQMDLQQQNYNAVRQKMELGRLLRHDMRHHLVALDGMLQQGKGEEAHQYIQELSGKLTASAQMEWCANTAVNAVLSAYLTQAEESGCSTSVEVRIPEKLPYGEMDLCILLANTLENAVRSCRELPGEKRQLWLKLELTGNQRFTLFVGNTCSRPVEIGRDGLPVSTQKGEGHGLGLRSVKSIVERHSGLMRCRCEEEKFLLWVALFPPGKSVPQTE